jgi:hypothetical protein
MSGEYKNVVGYSPSDFFYVSALDSSQGFDCEDPVLKKWILSADSSSSLVAKGELTGYNFCPTAAPCVYITAPPPTSDPAGTTSPPTSDPAGITSPPTSDPAGTTSTSTTTTSPPMDVPPSAKTIQLYKDICINKSLVNSWTDHKINHSGSEQALNDAQSRYHAAVLNTLNLVGGIGFIIWSFSSGWMYR